MAKNTPPVTIPTASSTNPTKPAAISINPDAVKTILDILGNIPTGDFFYNLYNILLDPDSGLDLKTYTGIVKALENVKFPNTNDDLITGLLFDILEEDADLPFSNSDDHFYLVVAETLYRLTGKEEHPRLRRAIIRYLSDLENSNDRKELLTIVDEI